MNRKVLPALAGSAVTLIAVAISGAATRAAHPAQAESTASQAVEYRIFVPSSTAAFTAEHEKELNALGAEGWRVVTPIYSGGILNSYLMMRPKR